MSEIHTKELLEEEHRQIKEREENLQKVICEIEDLLIKYKFTLKEWARIIEHFNFMSEKVITKMPIQELKQKFNN